MTTNPATFDDAPETVRFPGIVEVGSLQVTGDAEFLGDVIGGSGGFDVAAFGATGDGVADDSAAINAAIDAAIASFDAGTPAAVTFPAGVYRYVTPHAVIYRHPVSLIGAGNMQSIIKVDTALSGAVFSWSDVWMGADLDSAATPWAIANDTINPLIQAAGVTVSGLTVVGDRTAAAPQHAFVFYDHADQVHFFDVNVHYLKGRAFWAGSTLNSAGAYMRESRINRFRSFYCGDTATPVFEISADAASGDSSNSTQISEVDIYGIYGDGFVLSNNNPGSAVRTIRVNKLRVEGLETGGIAADLVRIGSPTLLGKITDVSFHQCRFTNPYASQAAVRVTASSAALQCYNIFMDAISVGGGAPAGKGLVIESCRDSQFYFSDLLTTDDEVTLGATTTGVGVNLVITGNGWEDWTWTVDTSISKRFQVASVQMLGKPGTTLNISAQPPDNGTTGGNVRGDNAVDLQMLRTAAAQVASGSLSFAQGQNNTASGISSVAMGATNTVSGAYSHARGFRGWDRGRYAADVWASGFLTTLGDAQAVRQLLRATASAAAPVVLTADGLAAGATNVVNILTTESYGFTVKLHARDTAGAKDYNWTCNGFITRDTNAASTTVTLGTPEILTRGSVTGASVALTADTTNAGIALAFDPPDGNTDTWHIAALVTTVEVQ